MLVQTKPTYRGGTVDPLLRRYPLHMIDGFFLQVLIHLPVVFANVLCIPSIAASSVFPVRITRKARSSAFQRHIPCTHYRLSDVFEAMVDMPGHLHRVYRHWRGHGKLHGIVRLEYCVETMQLVRDRRREYGLIGIIMDWVRQIGVFGRALDIDIA